MTTSNKPQTLLDSEIQDMLKSIARDAVDSFKNVTHLLALKAQQVDWDKLKSDTIKITAQSSAFCYKQFTKVDWMEVFEILVSGLLILGRGVYLAGFYTGKAMYWANDNLASTFKSVIDNNKSEVKHRTWNEVREELLSNPKVAEEYEKMKDRFQKIRNSIEAKAPGASTTTPTPEASTTTHTPEASTTTHTPAPGASTAPVPAPPASTATTPRAGFQYSATPNHISTTGLEHWLDASDRMLEVLEDCRQSTNEKIDELLKECDQMIKENDMEVQQYHDETVVPKDLWDLIAETADQQHQAMTEAMEPPTDLENFVDSICSEDTDMPHPLYESFNAMTVRQLKEITGMYSKKYKKEQLIEAAIEMQTA
jgi:hypothetical protein